MGYGLQCSTSKPNSHARSDDCLITIHTGDAFDLDEVAKTAWQIDKVRGNWSGVIHYMTDRTTKKLYGSNSVGETKSLYSISSRSFIKDSKNGGMDKKTIEHFINTFKLKFTEKAQDRQNLLKDVNLKKFLYK